MVERGFDAARKDVPFRRWRVNRSVVSDEMFNGFKHTLVRRDQLGC